MTAFPEIEDYDPGDDAGFVDLLRPRSAEIHYQSLYSRDYTQF